MANVVNLVAQYLANAPANFRSHESDYRDSNPFVEQTNIASLQAEDVDYVNRSFCYARRKNGRLGA